MFAMTTAPSRWAFAVLRATRGLWKQPPGSSLIGVSRCFAAVFADLFLIAALADVG